MQFMNTASNTTFVHRFHSAYPLILIKVRVYLAVSGHIATAKESLVSPVDGTNNITNCGSDSCFETPHFYLLLLISLGVKI